jgi:hypothetical protein
MCLFHESPKKLKGKKLKPGSKLNFNFTSRRAVNFIVSRTDRGLLKEMRMGQSKTKRQRRGKGIPNQKVSAKTFVVQRRKSKSRGQVLLIGINPG